jgi:hypothetical protein
VPDFYGADRIGNDLYADTLLALHANTGRLLGRQGHAPARDVLATAQASGPNRAEIAGGKVTAMICKAPLPIIRV